MDSSGFSKLPFPKRALQQIELVNTGHQQARGRAPNKFHQNIDTNRINAHHQKDMMQDQNLMKSQNLMQDRQLIQQPTLPIVETTPIYLKNEVPQIPNRIANITNKQAIETPK